ncbi:hypothetical protein [Paenibacillus sp. FJAT-27812]|uniref:hypothetical protein n=1 Tax=Paenibacillus sp. FJAT-27812 TaxID=1684143 RepID=UPI0006A777E5|nr:hypothetical protein [Paenibacillus sp. FJAT-27812]
MGKWLKRFLTVIIIIVLLLGGAIWWLLSYIAPDEKLDMSYAPIDVKEKALGMVRKLKPELVLSEEDINHLIKMNMKSKYAAEGAEGPFLALEKDIRLDGATFELEENKLIARMNVTYKNRIPAELDAVYSLDWQSPNITLRPQSLSIKEIALPIRMMETIIIPLDLPAQDIVTVRDVQFENGQIKIRFKVSLQLPL